MAAKPVLRVSASAISRADIEATSAAVLDPENLPKWFKGARDVKAGNRFPAVGGTLDWAVGGGRWSFHAVVERDDRPGLVVLHVRTPSGESRITHRFEVVAGGTEYTKTVEFTGSALHRLLVRTFLQRSVRGEVTRAAALVPA